MASATEPDRPQAAAYELLERLRWGGPPPNCPHCAAPGRCYLLTPVRRDGRRTRTGARTDRRVWKCGACRRQFSVLVGTILQGTRLDLWTWIAILRDWAVTDRLEAGEIADRYDLSPQTARAVADRIAAAGRLIDGAQEPSVHGFSRLRVGVAGSASSRDSVGS